MKAGEGVAVDPAKVKAILEWDTPTTIRGVRSFLGFAKLTKKNVEWRWGQEEDIAFEKLKKIFA